MPRIWALRKFRGPSVNAEVGKPTGTLSTRFSTWPSSATSTTSARSGSSRTNSTCLSRTLDFAVSTTPAARVRPDKSPEGFGQHRLDRFGVAGGGDLAPRWRYVVVGEIADLHQRIRRRSATPFRRQAPRRGVGRIDQAGLFQIDITLRTEAGDKRHRNDRDRLREPTGSPVAR